MHELSIVMSIVDLANQEVQKADATHVETIELEIGTLSGVEMEALDFAWQSSISGTVLENAERIVHRPEGMAKCSQCNHTFATESYFDPCPHCGEFYNEIIRGKELRVKTLTLVSD
ncbi:MAG: hydrogenase maturation nickel metallochaperone HypA [Bacteroidales bacterium]|nr:hydrogenase maturation nickel metallochaperone HypA [Bacteroidales bacterium]